MEDRTFSTNNYPTDGISDTFREYIAALVEEVVINGKPFDDQKKWLRKHSEAQGVDYAALEKNLTEFFETIEELKTNESKAGMRLAKMLATDSYLEESMVDKLVSAMDGLSRKARWYKLEGIDNSFNYVSFYNYVDSNGEVIIPEKWVDAWEFSEGLAAVAKSIPGKGWKYGFIDATGKTIIPFQWGNAESFHEGLACVSDDEGDKGYIDKTGRLVLPCKYGIAGYFSHDLAPIWDNNNCEGGYIDKTGRIVILQKEDWSELLEFREGLAPVRNKDDKWGFIDKNGNVAIPFEWKAVGWFGEGYAPVWDQAGRCGYIDKAGRVVVSLRDEWESAGWFSEGLAPVKNKDEKWGYIDKTGNVVLPYQWYDAWYFEEGTAWVKLPQPSTSMGYLGKEGITWVKPPQPSGYYRLINKTGEYIDKNKL